MTAAAGRHAIVLAAGAGRRFGGGKLTALWRGEPLVLAAVRTALSATVERVTVVIGADAGGLEPVLSPMEDERLQRVRVPGWEEGLAASLRAGVASLPDDARAVVVFLGDMPLIPGTLADRLIDAVCAGAPAAQVRSPLGPAHPVAFAAALFPALLGLQGDRGARSMIEAVGDAVATFDSDDPGVVFDVDHPADLVAGDVGEPAQEPGGRQGIAL